mgnify:CR=1 FL=1
MIGLLRSFRLGPSPATQPGRLLSSCCPQSRYPLLAAAMPLPWSLGPSPLRLSTPSRSFMGGLPLPERDKKAFTQYTEIDIPTEGKVRAMRPIAGPSDTWVGIEKVHGTNFGIYLLEERDMKFAKRSGIMDQHENFFGYHLLIPQFTAFAHAALGMLKEKFGLSFISKVILNGEMFGCKYMHPKVAKSNHWVTLPNGKKFPLAGVLIQKDPFPQYSPELHFFAFDLKFSASGTDTDLRSLPYDDMVAILDRIPNLLYGRPIVRGTLDHCLAFDVENFTTPLPGLLGLGNFPLEGNIAEGLVLRHIRRGDPDFDRQYPNSILKLRSSAFMELRHPGKHKELKEEFFDTVRQAAVKQVGSAQTAIPEALLPKIEAAANAVLKNFVSEGRLSNVVSKIGRGPLVRGEVTQADLQLSLAQDALKDFLKEADDTVLNTAISFRKMLIGNCYHEAGLLVQKQWADLMTPNAGDDV